MPNTCFASKYADLLPCLCTWKTSIWGIILNGHLWLSGIGGDFENWELKSKLCAIELA